jgi:hypothetical protein
MKTTNNRLLEIIEEIKKLPETERLAIIDAVVRETDSILDCRTITKDTIIEELSFRVENACEDENAEEIQMFIEEYDTDQVFDILKNCCNGNLIDDYSYWNEDDGDILTYIDFDEDEFVKLIYTLNTPARRERKLSLLGL